MSETSLVVKDNVLLVCSDLYWEEHEDFSDKCQKLLSVNSSEIVLDFVECGFVFSTYLGIIGSLFVEAREKGKTLRLRVSQRLEWIFQLAGFREMLSLEVVGDDQRGP